MEWTLDPLPDSPSLCPVTLLRAYIDRTSVFFQTRGSSQAVDPLFVRCDGGNRASSQLLSNWIRCVIIAAYEARLGTPPEERSSGLSSSVEEQDRRRERPYTGRSLCQRPASVSSVPATDADVSAASESLHPPDLARPAHELRAIAASLAYCKGTALSEMVRAVGWSNSCTFATFYLRNVSDVGAPHASLPSGGHHL
jgi:hypothetical protein